MCASRAADRPQAGPTTDLARRATAAESTDDGFERVTRLVLSQLAIQVGASLPWGLRAQAQANVQPDIADDYEPWLIEAFVRKEWAGRAEQGWGVQAGPHERTFFARTHWAGVVA